MQGGSEADRLYKEYQQSAKERKARATHRLASRGVMLEEESELMRDAMEPEKVYQPFWEAELGEVRRVSSLAQQTSAEVTIWQDEPQKDSIMAIIAQERQQAIAEEAAAQAANKTEPRIHSATSATRPRKLSNGRDSVCVRSRLSQN